MPFSIKKINILKYFKIIIMTTQVINLKHQIIESKFRFLTQNENLFKVNQLNFGILNTNTTLYGYVIVIYS